jgi:hypothetical protein
MNTDQVKEVVRVFEDKGEKAYLYYSNDGDKFFKVITLPRINDIPMAYTKELGYINLEKNDLGKFALMTPLGD